MESTHDAELIRYINLKLAALGQPPSEKTVDAAWSEIAGPLLRRGKLGIDVLQDGVAAQLPAQRDRRLELGAGLLHPVELGKDRAQLPVGVDHRAFDPEWIAPFF